MPRVTQVEGKYAYPSQHPAPGLKRAKKPRAFFAWVYPLACTAIVAALLVTYLCQSAHLVHLQYQLVQVKEQRAALDREKTDLNLEVQRLSSLARIEKVATVRLGMVPSTDRVVLTLAPDLQRQAALKTVVAENRLPTNTTMR